MVEWIIYVQLLMNKLMKGMLIGFVMILNWLFVCDDQLCLVLCYQFVLVICDEVFDFEQVGVCVIQIDEVVLCEGLLLCCVQWSEYLKWVVELFCIIVNGVQDDMQIYMYMCYLEFNDIIVLIVDMDVDVIMIEMLCFDMELFDVFDDFKYLNEIGLGVYDIYLLNILMQDYIVGLMRKVVEWILVECLWVNLDCGLKMCQWVEVILVLMNMVVVVKMLCNQVWQLCGKYCVVLL